MPTLAHPYRTTSAGTAAVLQPGSPGHAAQLAGHVLSTTPGERGLAPQFGLPDPAGGPLDQGAIRAALRVCAPDLDVTAVQITTSPADGMTDVTISVDWAGDL